MRLQLLTPPLLLCFCLRAVHGRKGADNRGNAYFGPARNYWPPKRVAKKGSGQDTAQQGPMARHSILCYYPPLASLPGKAQFVCSALTLPQVQSRAGAAALQPRRLARPFPAAVPEGHPPGEVLREYPLPVPAPWGAMQHQPAALLPGLLPALPSCVSGCKRAGCREHAVIPGEGFKRYLHACSLT